LAPLQKPAPAAALEASLKPLPDAPAKHEGIALGRRAALQLLALRQGDGADGKAAYAPGPEPAAWRPTPPGFAPAALPHWAQLKPFVIPGVDSFPLPGPPEVGSESYARDIEEVRIKGGNRAVSRNSEQAAIAIFWTIATAIPWNAAARSALASRNGSAVENARVLALMNLAAADSQIAVWAAKYRWNRLRPVSAIRDPRGLNNPGINADPT